MIGETNLSMMPQVFYNIAVFSTILFTIKLAIFSFFGGDTEVSGDFNTEFDTDTSFNFVSVQSLLAFLMGLGWMGYAALVQFGWSYLISVAAALTVGFIFMIVSAYLMFLVKKLEKRIVKDKSTAIGKIGKAYTNFAPNGNGQIEININEQISVVDAKNSTDEVIKAFDNIKVVKVENDVMLIEKI